MSHWKEVGEGECWPLFPEILGLFSRQISIRAFINGEKGYSNIALQTDHNAQSLDLTPCMLSEEWELPSRFPRVPTGEREREGEREKENLKILREREKGGEVDRTGQVGHRSRMSIHPSVRVRRPLVRPLPPSLVVGGLFFWARRLQQTSFF